MFLYIEKTNFKQSLLILDHSRNKSFLCFHCLKTLIENPSYNEADRVENMAICIKTLIKSVENRSINKSSKLVLSANIRKFLQRVLRTHLCSSWFISLFIHLSKVYFRNEVSCFNIVKLKLQFIFALFSGFCGSHQ